MSTSARDGYHHGDLRAALLRSATEMLEEGEPFSLRAVAKRAGVSATAPYRHYADKDALESALAAEGFRDLGERLAAAGEFAELGVAYVAFALERPALFRLMFGNPCDDANDERVRAAVDIRRFVTRLVAAAFPDADARALATAGWALVHGLAFLHLDGKLPAGDPAEVALRVRTSTAAIMAAGGPAAAG
ncbi:TetR/AcrR family transcriptional regulator [Paractinoplanes toevensis]|uniref:TetR family transcriptional regulator n=1 Tax=Paractinoplanes toevensis TaxID=571911 RepID=A0A919TDM2_9ACTN|nr:TetR/AcrR family transcriptional regulator [Actinoplanes toevensis]GIM93367.1 TetR family transcriptional regulator [Actinoplanes toevensis]